MKGKILEEIIQKMLLNQGYERLSKHDPKYNPSTGNFEGRGANHELDAFGQYKHSIPFVHPIRLLCESKCYKSSRSVGIPIIREAITVRKDISENYQSRSGDPANDWRIECFAVFSTSGFSSDAIELACAHGIYLVSLGHLLPIVERIVDRYDPQTHERVEYSVDSYFSDEMDVELYFGSLENGYPVALRGVLPKENLLSIDELYAKPTYIQTNIYNSVQFRLHGEEIEWESVMEVPNWSLENAIKQTEEKDLSIVIPTEINGIARQIRINIPIEKLRDLL
jgi:hypothetical protein